MGAMGSWVWFNKYLSNTWEIIASVRAERRAGEFRILCSHPSPWYRGRDEADAFEQEPAGLSERAYVDWCLDFARRRHVELFVPGRNLLPVLRAHDRFAGIGVRVLAAADAATVARLNHKAYFYRALHNHGFDLPEFAVVNDLAGFDAAWNEMRHRHRALCFKPAVGVYGLGFFAVNDGPAARATLPDEPWVIPLSDARSRLAAKGRFRDLMLMPYLPGPERSVDCLARDGELLRCVVRRKERAGQTIEDNAPLVQTVCRLTRHFRLSNLFNVQFRDAEGTPYLLEINPRMSGGLPFSCQAGVNLPLWSLRLALGTASPADIPQPASGLYIPQPDPMPSV